MTDLLVIQGILILCFELYRLLRGNWIQRFLKKKKGAAQPRKPRWMKPKSERDCPFCMKEKGRQGSPKPEMPTAWSLRKGRGGPKKIISTQGYLCPNKECEYYGITDGKYPCPGWIRQSWKTRADSRSQMPGLPEEIHQP